VTLAGRCCDAAGRVWGSTEDRPEGVSVAVRITTPAAPGPAAVSPPPRCRAAKKATDDQPASRRAGNLVDTDERE
jgi:hypothetical protein